MLSLSPAPLHDLGDDERLGRSVVSSKAAKLARTKRLIRRDVFLEAPEAQAISVDRMDHTELQEMADLATRRAGNRTPLRQHHGWAIVAVRDAESNGRTVEATPHPDNIYHADIILDITEDERRDRQKQHAIELAAHSQWLEAP